MFAAGCVKFVIILLIEFLTPCINAPEVGFFYIFSWFFPTLINTKDRKRLVIFLSFRLFLSYVSDACFLCLQYLMFNETWLAISSCELPILPFFMSLFYMRNFIVFPLLSGSMSMNPQTRVQSLAVVFNVQLTGCSSFVSG